MYRDLDVAKIPDWQPVGAAMELWALDCAGLAAQSSQLPEHTSVAVRAEAPDSQPITGVVFWFTYCSGSATPWLSTMAMAAGVAHPAHARQAALVFPQRRGWQALQVVCHPSTGISVVAV
jgi:hypothetical protein